MLCVLLMSELFLKKKKWNEHDTVENRVQMTRAHKSASKITLDQMNL